METKHVGDHEIRVGMELDGRGKHIHINGLDYTEKYLHEKGYEVDGHGMPVPRGDSFVANDVSMLIRSDDYPEWP